MILRINETVEIFPIRQVMYQDRIQKKIVFYTNPVTIDPKSKNR